MNLSIDLHEFSPEEYDLRISRTQMLMANMGLDALLITEEANYRLLSGARPVTKTRPVILIIPKEGGPTLIVNTFMESRVKQYTWVKDIRTYELQKFDLDPIKSVINDLGLTSSTIGAELSVSSFISPISLKLQQELPKAVFTDASQLILELRSVKTDAEVLCLRKACEISGKVYDKLFETIKEGTTEKEVAKILLNLFIEEGGVPNMFPGLLINSGGEYTGFPTDKPLRRGDLLWFDSGCSYKGYHSDFGRAGVVGASSKEQRETWGTVLQIANTCVRATKPGIKLNKIHKAGVSACKELGVDPAEINGLLAKRRLNIGHSVGLDGVEPPMLDPWNETIVKPNMVLTLEPTIIKKAGVYHIEYEVVVTEDGCEIISKGSSELFKIETR